MHLILSLALSAHAAEPSGLAKASAFRLVQTAEPAVFQGFSTFYAEVACPAYRHAAIGLTVDDAGHKTLYVIVTVLSSRGGFTTQTMTDNEADGTIDMVDNIPVNNWSLGSVNNVMECYLAK